MIDLKLQINLIIFSFIFGFLFSALIEWFNEKIIKYSMHMKLFFSVFLIIIVTILYFIGILKIGNAIFHIYSIFSIIIGFVMYDIIINYIANSNKK